MSSAAAVWPQLLLLSLCAVLFGVYLRFKLRSSKYWAERNVPYLRPSFLFGNMWKVNVTVNFSNAMEKIHLDNRSRKAIGLWMFTKPVLLVTDLQLAKRILITDFHDFHGRGLEIDQELDPLSQHLFMLSGKKWRNLRVKLTPTFTSGKMKLMFPVMVACGEELRRCMAAAARASDAFDVKDILSCFTMDVIASAAFGLDISTMKNSNSEFSRYGRSVFKPTLSTLLRNIIMVLYPGFAKKFSIRVTPQETTDFFISTVKDTVEYRERNNVTRNDFLQLLIQLIRNGKVEDADKNPINVDGMDDEDVVQKFSLKDAAAQCFIFFVAGFETSSTALMFALYELALNPDIQRRLQEEMDETVEKLGLTYEAMASMEYLDMVVQETLRKYPPAGTLQRISNSEYHIPELGATLDKGTSVLFSVRGFHYDPDLYPDPERFDPERFSPEEKSRRETCAFLPFGEGPRACIGNRFALMQIKIGLISILKDLKVAAAKATPVPIKYDVWNFTPHPVGGMPLSLSQRT